ncbi:MAG: ATP-binding protein [Blastocatellia bacterium]|nr:ATP-binding protein [Blastocatellia bacterium]
MTTPDLFRNLIESPENAQVEFKAASGGFQFDELAKYCVALANEGGGKIILGVTDKRPRTIVGTTAFSEPGRTEAGLFDRLGHQVLIEEYQHEKHRVLIIHVPARLPGTAWHDRGTYWMRAGDALVPMSDERLRRIHTEAGPDFSAEICADADLTDLDPIAIDVLRQLWQRKAPTQNVELKSNERLLADAELILGNRITWAAIILLGTREALGRLLGQAEVVFEYRSSDSPGPAAERREFRQGALAVLDEIWRLVNTRNDLQHFQQGLFIWDVPTFDERAIREAVLNAISHRDYRRGGSIFIRQYPRRIEIVSPGGFPLGITEQNLIWEQNPRNRRIAEVLGKCGLVERAGQGFDLIFRACIQQSKPLPDFSRTGEHSVWLTLRGEIQDPEFLRFLEEIGRERLATFSIEDFLVVDLVHREHSIPAPLATRLPYLLEQGVLERVGRGRGVHYLLSRRFYRFLGKGGVYTRRRGLDRDTNKTLLLRHIESSPETGSRLEELQQVLPALSRDQVRTLLRELKRDHLVEVQGTTNAARWFPSNQKRNSRP